VLEDGLKQQMSALMKDFKQQFVESRQPVDAK
jgi:hypothetical protein